MFENIQSLLEFIENAKKANIKSFQIGDIKVEFSDFAFIEKMNSDVSKSEERSTSKTMIDTLSGEEDEELLFWSSNKA